MQRAIFNTILEVRVIDMVDHCGQGLFHHIAWQNRPIQIITVGGPGYLGIWKYPLDIPGTPSPDQQFSRATILAYDGQVAVVRHYPHLLFFSKYGDVSLFADILCGDLHVRFGSKTRSLQRLGSCPASSVDVGGSIPSPPTTAGPRHARVSNIWSPAGRSSSGICSDPSHQRG